MSRFLKRRDHDSDNDDDDDSEEMSGEEEDNEDDEVGDMEHDHDHELDDEEDDEEEESDDLSADLLGPRNVAASYRDLASILSRLIADYQNAKKSNAPLCSALAVVIHDLKEWCGRSMNDRERGTNEKNAEFNARCAGLEVEVAKIAPEILKDFLENANDVVLGDLLFVLETVKSQQAHALERQENDVDRLGFEMEEDAVMALLWATLDEQREQLEPLLAARLAKALTGNLQTFSLSQAFLFDVLRDVWCKFMLNWMLKENQDYNMADPFLGYPGRCPGFPEKVADPSIRWEAVISSMPTPEMQRSALIFIEAFFYLLDRDVLGIMRPDLMNIQDIETVGGFVLPALVGCLQDPNVDETTKMFALRCLDIAPLIAYTSTNKAPPPFDVFASILRTTQDPLLIYQTAACTQSICGSASGDVPDIVVRCEWRKCDFGGLMEALFSTLRSLQKSIGTSSTPSDHANAAMCIGPAVVSLFQCWQDTPEVEEQFKAFQHGFLDQCVRTFHAAVFSKAHCYLEPSLLQLCTFSLPPQKVHDASVANSPCGRTVAAHALYSQLLRLSVVALYCSTTVLCSGSAQGMEGPAEFAPEHFPLLMEAGEHILDVMMDVGQHILHPESIKMLCQDEETVMDHIVNGGHLDSGARVVLNEADQICRMSVSIVRSASEYLNLLRQCILRARKKQDVLRCMKIWAKFVDRCEWTDNPTILEIFNRESRSELCVPTTLGRLVERLNGPVFVCETVMQLLRGFDFQHAPAECATILHSKLLEVLRRTALKAAPNMQLVSQKDTSFFHVESARFANMVDRRTVWNAVAYAINAPWLCPKYDRRCKDHFSAEGDVFWNFVRAFFFNPEYGLGTDMEFCMSYFANLRDAYVRGDKLVIQVNRRFFFEMSSQAMRLCDVMGDCLEFFGNAKNTGPNEVATFRIDAREWRLYEERVTRFVEVVSVIVDFMQAAFEYAELKNDVADELTVTAEAIVALLHDAAVGGLEAGSLQQVRAVGNKLLRIIDLGLNMAAPSVEQLRKVVVQGWQAKLEDAISTVMKKFL